MLSTALFFIAGVLAVQYLPVLPEAREMAFICMAIVLFAGLRFRRLSMLVSGILWSVLFATTRMDDRLPADWPGGDVMLRGYIVSPVEREDNRVRFDFAVSPVVQGLPERLRLSWYYPKVVVKSGQYWRFKARLKPPHGLFNPGGFDFERWLFVHGTGATGYVRSRPPPELLPADFLRHPLSRWRQAIADRLHGMLQDNRQGSLLKALTLGDRSAMTARQWEVLRKTGTAHLLAISGLHIGLIAALVYLLAVKLWAASEVLSLSPQRVGAVCALLAAGCYAALSGFALPTRRALIMLAVAFYALYRQRHITPSRTFAIAALAVVALDPGSVLSAGFWLSFIAVALILFVLSARLRKPGYWRALVKIHWVTAFGLAPPIMLYFQQVSLTAPLANLLAVPLVAWLVVPLSLSAVALSMIYPALAEPLFTLAGWILDGLWVLLSAIADLPYAALNTAQPSLLAVASAMLGVLVMLLPKGMAGRYPGALLCLPLLFVSVERPESGEIRLTLLDVGQGLSAVVETRNHVLVFDSGAKYSRQFDMGAAVVVPYLRYRGITGIDTVLISHGDNDHSGGLESIVSMMPVARLIGDVKGSFGAIEARPCMQGEKWRWDGVRFAILSPPGEGYFRSENDNSCVLKITAGRHSVLLPGDIEESAESRLVARYGRSLAASVLVSPHHGSRTSSGMAFLQAVDPDVVLIPSGFRNRFALPHSEVLQRYKGLDIDWLVTAQEGAIVLTTQRENMEVESSRAEAGRYWHSR